MLPSYDESILPRGAENGAPAVEPLECDDAAPIVADAIAADTGVTDAGAAAVSEADAAFEERFREWKRTGDPRLREELILSHMNLVRFLARKFRDRGESVEDLVQQGAVGLINAIDRFEPDRGVKFSTYATPTVLGEIKRYFRDKGWGMKVPRRLQELSLESFQTVERLSQQLGRSPTYEEIAGALSVPVEDVVAALDMSRAYDLASLDAEVRTETDDGMTLGDRVGAPDPQLRIQEIKTPIDRAMRHLDERERKVVRLTFYQQMSQTEIARVVGCSQMHVSRILRKALLKMRRALGGEDGEEF